MSIDIFTDRTGQSVMYDSNSEIAFGPVFGSDETPQDFLDWLNVKGIRPNFFYPQQVVLVCYVDTWREEVKESEAEAAGERAMNEPEAWNGGFAKNH